MKTRISLPCFIVLLCWCFTALIGQNWRLNFQHLSQSNGLSESVNAYVYKDSRGFIWASSLEGLNRFDGVEVKVYKRHPQNPNTLAGNLISSDFYEDEAGNLWFTTHEAIQCYRRQTDDFATYLLTDATGDTIREDYYAFHLSDNQFWVRTGLRQHGRVHLFSIDTQKNSILFPLNAHRCQVYTNSEDEITYLLSTMLPSNGTGLEWIRLQANKPPRRDTFFHQSKAGAWPKLRTKNAWIESDTSLWIGTDQGLLVFNPQSEAFQIFDGSPTELTGRIWDLAPYESHLLFVSTYEKGVWVFDREKRTFVDQIVHQSGQSGSLRDDVVRELYIDDHHNLWVSMWSYGLDYANLKKKKFRTLLAREQVDDRPIHIYGICETANGSILCGAAREQGLFMFNQAGALKQQFLPNRQQKGSLSTNSINHIFRDREDQIWIVTHFQLQLFNEQQGTFTTIGTEPAELHYIFQTKNGRLLLASQGIKEIVRGPEGYQIIPCPEFAGRSSEFLVIYQDRENRLYFSENGESLLIYREGNDGFVFETTLDGVGHCNAFQESVDGKNLWVASSYGVLKMPKDRPQDFRILNLSEDGLPAEAYYSILPDELGQLWLSSNHGLVVYQPQKKQYHRYGLADGLQGLEFNANAYLAASDGQFWLGGLNGLNVFQPTAIAPLPFSPQTYLKNILINDESRPLPATPGELPQLELSYNDNTVSFEFVALEYSNAAQNRYKYRLKNLDEDWVDNGNRGFARYPNIPAGKYQFQILSANSDGLWSTMPKTFDLTIHPPFWQRWWFYLLCILGISSLIYMLFQYRLQQILKLERMRIKISSDLHDDVGTILSGLAMQTEILELKARQEDKPKLQRIGEMSRNAMSRMRDTVWAIDARKDRIENLLDRMVEHAEEVLAPADIHYDIQTKGLDLRQKLPTQLRQNLYLIYKESITNIIRHSDADRVTIKLLNEGSSFEMLIQDNGSFSQKDYKTTGLGLSNIQMRAQQINAQVECKARPDGYRVWLQRRALG